jgi:magnesium transporter
VMPELHWHLGYGFALALMIGSAAALWASFKRRGWL